MKATNKYKPLRRIGWVIMVVLFPAFYVLALLISPFAWIIRGEHLMNDLGEIYKECYKKSIK